MERVWPAPLPICNQSIRSASARDQFQKYVNRFGPGMVVYWAGFVDELDTGAGDIVLADSFPPASEVMQLPRLPLPASDERGSGTGI